jgi:hypothetical protein
MPDQSKPPVQRTLADFVAERSGAQGMPPQPARIGGKWLLVAVAAIVGLPAAIAILPLFPFESAQTQADAPVVAAGGWQTHQWTSPIDDRKGAAISLVADREPVELFIKCWQDEFDVVIYWGTYLAGDGPDYYKTKNVTARFGDRPATTHLWTVSKDELSTYVAEMPEYFIRRLLDVDRYVAQIEPYHQSPMTAVFDLTGMRAAFEPVAASCGWDLDTQIAIADVTFDGKHGLLRARGEPAAYTFTNLTKGVHLIQACVAEQPSAGCRVGIRQENGIVSEIITARPL